MKLPSRQQNGQVEYKDERGDHKVLTGQIESEGTKE
jgi:hypothetical protein